MNLLKQNDVAIYCSKLSKIEISVEEQMKCLKRYCKHFGLNIVKEYVDTDNVNKPLFNQMIEDIKTKAFNIVLSYSFDTLTKSNEELQRLVIELDRYNYELQLENSYKYKVISKPLFKLPRDDEAEQNIITKPKRKKNTYPLFKTIEVKNPQSENPYNWVELLEEDKFRFEDTSIFDSNGNYMGVSRDVYVLFKEITGFCRTKTRIAEMEMIEKEKGKTKARKLFDTSSDIVAETEEENA